MRVTAKAEGDPGGWALGLGQLSAEAVTVAMATAADGMKADIRAMIAGAGMGVRLGNAVRGASYPKPPKASLRAAAQLTAHGSAADIVIAFSSGLTIAGHGKLLAIPTEAVPRGRYNQKLTPKEVELRFLQKLRLRVYLGGAMALVLQEGRVTRAGRAKGATRRQVARGQAKEIVMFWLKPMVRLPRRLSPNQVGAKWYGELPRLIDRAAAALGG